MSYREKIYYLGESVVDVEQLHSYLYPQTGCRGPKRNPTTKEMARVNEYNRFKTIRRKLLMYFTDQDYFVTLTYNDAHNPADIQRVKKDFTNFVKKLKRQYAKKGMDVLIWMRNIERTKDGRYHIHVLLPFIEGAHEIIIKSWKHGKVHFDKLFKDFDYDGLVRYITKTPVTDEKNTIVESNFSMSHNMKLPAPIVTKYKQDTWDDYIVIPIGYSLIKNSIREIKHDLVNYKSRSYTLIRNRDYGNVTRCGLDTGLHACQYLLYGKLCNASSCCSFKEKVICVDDTNVLLNDKY